MYGKKGTYFCADNKQFHNSIWIELIGFEKNSPDYGVQAYLDTIGFLPDSISLLLTSVDFVNTHRGMEETYVLPPYACSYGGHAENDERKRQDWTNQDLRGLIQSLHAHNIPVFVSFFDFCNHTESTNFTILHPELRAGNTNHLLMIKRFADGTYYEDYLLKKLLEVTADYGFDGVQLADGISCPRDAIWFADFSDDLLEQAGIELPSEVEDAGSYISKHLRREWIAFYRRRWDNFLIKTIRGLKQAGLLVAVNSAWTKDPFEALYRYGADYRTIAQSGADYFIVEDVSSDLAILSDEDNLYAYSYEERKQIHYEFVANLMCLRAHMPEICVTPLFPLWDNQEQWNVIHHAPTAMQRAAAANFTHLSLKDGHWQPVTDGPHFCLSDALQKQDWDFIRLCIDNGYTPECTGAEGATFLWSAQRMEQEMEQFISCGIVHSARWLALLLRAGAAIQKVADISQLDQLTGDLVVSNISLLPEAERKAIDAYQGGRVIAFDAPVDPTMAHICNPPKPGWPTPMLFAPVETETIQSLVATINKTTNASLVKDADRCTIREILTGKNTSRILIDNNEYYYVLPKIHTRRAIHSIKIITKPNGYPLQWDAHNFRVRVPGRGVDIAEIQYEDEPTP